jgi:hypothetical protein
MVDLDGDRASPPFRNPTFATAVFKNPEPQQRALDRQPAGRTCHDFLERPFAGTRSEVAPRYRFLPRAGAKLEAIATRAIGVAFIVKSLNLEPIVDIRLSATQANAAVALSNGQESRNPSPAPCAAREAEPQATLEWRVASVVKRLHLRP